MPGSHPWAHPAKRQERTGYQRTEGFCRAATCKSLAVLQSQRTLEIPNGQTALLSEPDDVLAGRHGINDGVLILLHSFRLQKSSFPKEVFQNSENASKNQALF